MHRSTVTSALTVPRGCRSAAGLVICLCLQVFCCGADEPQAANSQAVEQQFSEEHLNFFESRIRPVLIKHCYECHAAESDQIRGGLLLDSRAALLQGGDSGPAVIPGDPENSQLLLALRHETYEMPPEGRLPDSIVQDFSEWIAAGAADPRTGKAPAKSAAIDLEAGRQFWSFQPVIRPQIPQFSGEWARNDIDRLLQHHWRQAGLTEIPEDADSQTILQRLHLVLSGLLPAAADRRRFQQEYAANPDLAIEHEVDRLLAAREYSERFGRRFLDVLRYAESTGGGRSMMLPEAWRFRDYVIQSFAEDRPYDVVLRELLAGDLLPFETNAEHDRRRTAAGFLVLGAINYEQQDKELLRMEVVDEQIDTVGQAFLGMTLGCARCHDHKFDPVPTADYYALAGIFRSTKSLTPGNVSGWVTADLREGDSAEKFRSWESRNRELQQQLAAAKQNRSDAADLPGQILDEAEAELEGRWVLSTFQQPWFGEGYHHSDDPRTGRSARWKVQVPTDGLYSVRMVINASNNRSPQVPVRIVHAGGESVVNVDQQKRNPGGEIFRELGRYRLNAAQPLEVEVDAAAAAPGHVIVDAIHVVLAEELDRHLPKPDSDPAALEAAIAAHAKLKPQVARAMSVTDESDPADWHLHVRGQIRSLGPIVRRGFLQVASAGEMPARLPQGESGSGRLQLAEWLTHPANPLTPRVWSNRLWGWVMGQGLVRTPDNFGLHGQRPDSSELLDYLAYSLVHEDQWSTRAMIRRLCTSRVFRISSGSVSRQAAGDPDNRLWARGFARKLDAEDIRDRMLQVSGKLDRSIQSGSTIGKVSQYDSGYQHADYPLYCRSVYIPVFRNAVPDIFEVFDFPNPNTVSGRRADTTRAAQALYLLNSEFVMQQAELAAERLLTEFPDSSPRDLIRHAVERSLGRAAVDAELQLLEPSVLDSAGTVSFRGLTLVFHSLFASLDFRYVK